MGDLLDTQKDIRRTCSATDACCGVLLLHKARPPIITITVHGFGCPQCIPPLLCHPRRSRSPPPPPFFLAVEIESAWRRGRWLAAGGTKSEAPIATDRPPAPCQRVLCYESTPRETLDRAAGVCW